MAVADENALILVSATLLSLALLQRWPHEAAVPGGVLIAEALASVVLSECSSVCNPAFVFRQSRTSGLALGVLTVPCTLAAAHLQLQLPAQAAELGLLRAHLHAALAAAAVILVSAGMGWLARPADARRIALNVGLVSASFRAMLPSAPLWLYLIPAALVEPCVRMLLAHLPRCFSLGEACALSLGLGLLSTDVGLLLLCDTTGRGSTARLGADMGLCVARDETSAVAEVGLLCAVLLGGWLAASRALALRAGGGRRPTRVYANAAAFVVCVLYPLLRAAAGGEPLAWLCGFIASSRARAALLLYWLLVTAVGTCCISVVRARLPLIVVRKLYHALATLLFVPGILIDPKLMRLSFAIAIALFLALEYIRMSGAPPLAEPLSAYLRLYTDSRDAGPLITTHIYLLLGCALPLLATPGADAWDLRLPHEVLPPLAGVLALGVGDSVASYVGTRVGRTCWRGTSKTVEGTLAAVIAVMVGAIGLYAGALSLAPQAALASAAEQAREWQRVLVATLATCVLEAVTDQIDNLFLPLYFFCALQIGRPAAAAAGLVRAGDVHYAPPS